MKKFFLLITLVCLGMYQSGAQKLLAEINSKPINYSELVCRAVKDSVLISYTVNSIPEYYWLVPQKAPKRAYLFSAPLIFTEFDGQLYSYTYDAKTDFINVAVLDEAGKWNALRKNFKVDGYLIGSFEETNLFFVFYNSDLKEVSILEINKDQEIKRARFAIADEYTKGLKKERKIHLYSKYATLETFNKASAVKMYWEGSNLKISIDGPNVPERTKPSYVNILSLNYETGSIAATQVPVNDRGTFSSFHLNDTLYLYYLSAKRMALEIIDVKTNQTIQKLTTTPTPDHPAKIYSRTTLGNSDVSIGIPLERLTKAKAFAGGDPNLQVLKENNQTYLKAGLEIKYSKAIGPSGGILAMVVGTAFRQVAEDPDTSTIYCFYTKNSNNEYVINSETNFLRNKIDKYEADLHAHGKISFKSYTNYKSGILAVYNDKKTDKLSFVLFE